MFAYAEETGNSGRNIFDENEYFRLGAILTVNDIAPAVDAVFTPLLAEKSIDRFDPRHWSEEELAKLGHEVLDAIECVGPWAFSLTEIHKPYMATTKLVDVIFVAEGNERVLDFWYFEEVYRHILGGRPSVVGYPTNTRIQRVGSPSRPDNRPDCGLLHLKENVREHRAYAALEAKAGTSGHRRTSAVTARLPVSGHMFSW